MRMTRLAVVSAALLLLVVSPTVAADAPNATGVDRLFLAFAEDTAFTRSQWWEGQAEYADGAIDKTDTDATIARLIVAFQPWSGVEIGGRVGFGNTDARPGTPSVPDGSGATDVDVWAKWFLGNPQSKTNFSVGGLATVPTGDDTAGLGYDAFSFLAFGSLRSQAKWGQFVAHVGLRFNGDGMIQGAMTDGKTTFRFGGGVVIPLSDPVSFVGEVTYESDRFEAFDPDARALGGINWRPGNVGAIRAAISIGLDDGAPDLQVFAGYAHIY